jgi:hypothetical protein
MEDNSETKKKALTANFQDALDIYEKRERFMDLKTNILKKSPRCSLIIIENFYNNPNDTRNYILTQEFEVRGNFPGQRTISYASESLKETIQKYILPFAGKITDFPMTSESYNGSFQYTTSRDHSWVHVDGFNNWAGVLFLTPDAPLSSGTAFYQFQDGTMNEEDQKYTKSKGETDKYSQDMTKWKLVDRVGNVFNRLILFNSKNYHMSMDYFGDNKYNGRLFQVFFFSTEI